MPVTPLAAAALVALCFALPFGVAALFDDGAEPRSVAVATPAVESLDDERPTDVRISTLDPAPRLPALRSSPEEEAPSAATVPAPAADLPTTAPAPAPTSGGGELDAGSSGAGGTSDRFDSTR